MPIVKCEIKNRLTSNANITQFSYEPVNICPRCKHAIYPVTINHLAFEREGSTFVSLFEFCYNCCSPIINTYSCYFPSTGGGYGGTLYSSEPMKYSEIKFDEKINSLSPQFTIIYNQSSAAESHELNEIAGLGYRKSLEFLVKDFAIYENPESEEEIKKLTLSQCINKYMDNPQIKILVERSTWIGNDEAHYVRKQANRDVKDMKEFISATVYFIGMVLITKDAASMKPVK